MSNDWVLKSIKEQLKKEQEELASLEKMAIEFLPILNKLTKSDIGKPEKIKKKLSKLDEKHRDVFYVLFRIATEYGPEGSFINLSPEKVLRIINDQ